MLNYFKKRTYLYAVLTIRKDGPALHVATVLGEVSDENMTKTDRKGPTPQNLSYINDINVISLYLINTDDTHRLENRCTVLPFSRRHCRFI
jgi:hypothetical protein